MDRKTFFKNLLLGGAGVVLLKQSPALPIVKEHQEIMLAHRHIAGFQYYNGYEVQHLLEKDMPLQLHHQPQNPYDPYAIEVYTGDAKLGYLPRNENKTIATLMDQGIDVKARLTELDAKNYQFVAKVKVYYMREMVN